MPRQLKYTYEDNLNLFNIYGKCQNVISSWEYIVIIFIFLKYIFQEFKDDLFAIFHCMMKPTIIKKRQNVCYREKRRNMF